MSISSTAADGEVRINRGATLLVEVCERCHKLWVRLVLFGYQLCKPLAECGDHLLKFCDGGVPIFKCSRRRSEEVLEGRNQDVSVR